MVLDLRGVGGEGCQFGIDVVRDVDEPVRSEIGFDVRRIPMSLRDRLVERHGRDARSGPHRPDSHHRSFEHRLVIEVPIRKWSQHEVRVQTVDSRLDPRVERRHSHPGQLDGRMRQILGAGDTEARMRVLCFGPDHLSSARGVQRRLVL